MTEENSRILVFIPTYNESGNIEALVSRLLALPYPLDLLFLDDNSPDGTGKILDRFAGGHQNISVIHRPRKLGIGSAHRDGIRWAYDRGYSTVLTMDADLTHPPEVIPQILQAQALDSKNHIVLASRFLRANSLKEWTLWRRFLTHFGHLLTQVCLRMPFDATGAFRLYRLDLIPSSCFSAVNASGYAFFYESLFLFHRNGYRIRELPVELQIRNSGESKLSLREIGQSFGALLFLSIGSLLAPSKFRIEKPLKEKEQKDGEDF